MGLFTPDQAFDVVAKSQIERLKGPCLDLVDKVTLEMYTIARAVIGKVVCPNVLHCHVMEKGECIYGWFLAVWLSLLLSYRVSHPSCHPYQVRV